MGMRARKPEVVERGLPEVGWRDVAKHNKKEDCWVTVDDVAYDLTKFVDKHPGGEELMVTFAGREATHAFNSYHALSYAKAQACLKNYAVARVTDSEFQRYPTDNKVYAALTEKVKAYFVDNKIDPKDWKAGAAHFLFMLAIQVVACCLMWAVFPVPGFVQFIGAVMFGWMQALPLLHIMHDCSHGAFSHTPFLWDFVGKFTMDLYAGASMTAWHLQHVVGHHVWTNVFEADPDLPPVKEGDPRRLVDKQQWSWIYKYQHLYLPVAYGSLGLKVRMSDITHAFGGEYAGPMRVRHHTTEWIAKWFIIKTLWVLWRIVFPMVVLGVSWQWNLASFLIGDMVTGWYLAFNFQVSHISAQADYPFGSDDRAQDVCEDEWAVSQIRTSVDYAHDSPLMSWLCGHLNYQTVHHLFPGISQYHYPALAPIIQDVCKKHDVKYNYIPSFGEALWSHFSFLKDMGQKGTPAPLHMG